MNPPDPIASHDDQLDAQASAFARLLGLTPNDLEPSAQVSRHSSDSIELLFSRGGNWSATDTRKKCAGAPLRSDIIHACSELSASTSRQATGKSDVE